MNLSRVSAPLPRGASPAFGEATHPRRV